MITWSHEVTWLIKNNISALSWGLWLPDFTRRRFIVKGRWSYHVTGEKRYISTSARPMTIKLDRVVGSNARLLSIRSHDLLMTWSHKVTWQMKNVLNSLSGDLSLLCPTTKPHIPSITWLREFTWQMNFVSIATKSKKVMVCIEEAPLTKSCGSLIINGSCIDENI